MGGWNPLVTLATVGGHHAQARPGEVETKGALLRGSDFGEDLLPGRDGRIRIVVEVDEPVRVFEHQHMVVGEV